MRGLPYAIAFTILTAASLQAQQFGAYAAIRDGQILISEPVKQSEPATIYIYRRAGGGWERSGTLTAPEHEGGDYFGRFIAMDDRSMIIGSTLLDQSTGAAFVYRRDGDDWAYAEMLRPADVGEGDAFGRFGLLQGDLLFVSALGHNESRGAVYVYHRDASGGWSQEAKLVPGDSAPPQEFLGWSLAFDGERLLTGALQASQALQQRGGAYVFRRNATGDWALEQRFALDEADRRPGDTFGSSVAWMDGQALIGVPGRDQGTGEIRTYRRGSAGWEAGPTLNADPRESGSRFGSTLLAANGELWVGAPGAGASGRVYRLRFDGAPGEFTPIAALAGPEADVGDNFGDVIAVGGNLAVIGATGDDFGLGSAIIMERDGDTWRASDKLLGPEPDALSPIVGGEVACSEGKADQFDCKQVDIVSFLPVRGIGGGRGAKTNDVWGWTDPASGREYAIVGRTDGTAFIDVTDAARPTYLGNLPKTAGSRGNAWRDIKVYANHAFVVADGAGPHGVQVFDLTHLRDVRVPPVTFEEDAHYDGIASAHNIVINEQTGFAYAVGVNSGGETCGGGLHMIDVRAPTRPAFAGCFADTTTGNARTGYSHDGMCIVYSGPDAEHVGKEICFGSNETALSIADVTDKAHPVRLSAADYPNVGYAHQGWITEDQRYFFMDDEGDESNSVQAGEPMPGTRTLIWDIQDLDDPIMVKEHFGETFTIDHNLYIKGTLMYQSNYVSGLRVLDISDPENPTEVGYFDTVPWSEEVEFDGSWSNYPFFESGTIVVSSGQEGVFFLKYRPLNLVP
ncbi:MAG TPA: choice-of-anchor B family protein [Gemmatimonadales bacterium]